MSEIRLSEITNRLRTLEAKVDESSAEILAELTAYRRAIDEDPALAMEILGRIEDKVGAMASISPPVDPVEPIA